MSDVLGIENGITALHSGVEYVESLVDEVHQSAKCQATKADHHAITVTAFIIISILVSFKLQFRTFKQQVIHTQPSFSFNMTMNLNATMLPLVVLLLAAMSPTTSAFVQHRSSPSRSVGIASLTESRLYYSRHGQEDSIDASYTELQKVERARASFEDLFKQAMALTSAGKSKSLANPASSSSISQQPILTTGGRRRRQLEMDLLKSLSDSDDAADELVNLWMHETGDRQAAAVMAAMQEACSPGLVREERDLLAMIAEYPSWAEPRLRLAFVYYFQERFEESTTMAKKAVQCKPWHFEASRLLVILSGQQIMLGRKSTPQALLEAHEQALPNLKQSLSDGESYAGRSAKVVLKRRRAWVDQALDDAAYQWKEAEKATQQAFQDTYMQTNGLAFE
jgi:hypothetical protein